MANHRQLASYWDDCSYIKVGLENYKPNDVITRASTQQQNKAQVVAF